MLDEIYVRNFSVFSIRCTAKTVEFSFQTVIDALKSILCLETLQHSAAPLKEPSDL